MCIESFFFPGSGCDPFDLNPFAQFFPPSIFKWMIALLANVEAIIYIIYLLYNRSNDMAARVIYPFNVSLVYFLPFSPADRLLFHSKHSPNQPTKKWRRNSRRWRLSISFLVSSATSHVSNNGSNRHKINDHQVRHHSSSLSIEPRYLNDNSSR